MGGRSRSKHTAHPLMVATGRQALEGHDAKKNANEVALEAILKVFTVGTSDLSDEEWMKWMK